MSRRKKTSSFFSKIQFNESYSSFLLGLIGIVIIGILILFFLRLKTNNISRVIPTPSTITKMQKAKSTQTQKFYAVQDGDSLWAISERVYKSGYNWVDIAKTNNLENPSIIYSGNKLILPQINNEKKMVAAIDKQAASTSIYASDSEIKSFSITTNSYSVVEGDNLWNIAVRAYGDGYRWVDIAKANNLVNPDLIFPGNVLSISR